MQRLIVRPLGWLLIGVFFGAFSVASFAQVTQTVIDLGIRVAAPANVATTGAWDAIIPGLEAGYRASDFGAGSGEVYRGAAVRVDNIPVTLEAKRRITAANIAKGAVGIAKRGGPAGIIGSVLLGAGLEWAGDQWANRVPADNTSATSSAPYYDYLSCPGLGGRPLSVGQCGVNNPQNSTYGKVCNTPSGSSMPGWSLINYCPNGSKLWYKSFTDGPYSQPTELVDATDTDIQDALTDNLVDGDLDPAEALRQIMEGADGGVIVGDFDPVQVSGPTTIQGPTVTTTSSGPAGQTTTTTTTDYGLTHSGDSTTVTKSTSTSVTDPAGQTTTTTSTSAPSSSQTPAKPETPPEPKTDCDKYPNASGCVELGKPLDDVQLETDDIDIGALDYQSVIGSCPAPQSIDTALGGFSISYEVPCTAAEFLRPIIILSGLLMAGIFVFWAVGSKS